MSNGFSHTARKRAALVLSGCALLLALSAASALDTNSFAERRLHVGIKLFRILLAADLDLTAKTDPRGELPLYLLYLDDPSRARAIEDRLRQQPLAIREHSVQIESISITALLRGGPRRPAGLFLAQRVPDRVLRALIHYSVERRLVLFSPFEGDVERGVVAGVAVESTVRPYLNLRTLEAGQLRIKSFFLKAAKLYDETD